MIHFLTRQKVDDLIHVSPDVVLGFSLKNDQSKDHLLLLT